MKNLFICLLTIVGISLLGSKINAAYRMPFNDNLDLRFSQTWHAQGSYYDSSNNYQWSIGPDYAIDLVRSDGSVADVIAPENGVVRYRQNCLYSANLVLEFGDYQMQFYHLSKNSVNLNTGNSVVKGQYLGTLYSGAFQDSCGKSGGTHLHLRFETQQGNNDPSRIEISGYKFDQYDYGVSECIMNRVENGQNVRYCWAYNATGDIFTANEPGGVPVSSCLEKNNWVTNGPGVVSSSNCVIIKGESVIKSTNGTTRIFIQ